MRHQRPARERDWLERLFDRHVTQLRAFAVRRVGANNADDIVADVFATAWRRRAHVPDPALPWLFQTARNVTLHHYRSEARRTSLQHTLETTLPPAAAPSAEEQARSLVDDLLDRLDDTDAEVLRLTVWEQLRQHDPAAHMPAFSATERDRILQNAIRTAPPTVRTREQRTIRVLVAASAALVVGGLGYQSVAVGAATAHASELLAQAAIRATDPVSRPGQYWELTSSGTSLVTEYAGLDTRVWLTRTTNTDYVAVDGKRPSWFIREPTTVERQLLGTPADRTTPYTKTAVWTTNLTPEQIPASWNQPSPTWLASLPRDTQALRDRLYADNQGHGNNLDDQAFTAVADVLSSGLVPADLRSALYEVLRSIPGATLTDDSVTLSTGHTGVGIGRHDAFGGHQSLVIDPDTGQVLGEITETTFIPVVGPTISTEQTIERRLVDSIPQPMQDHADRQHCTITNNTVTC
jgi:RNA polymerase sigma-70 factor (ECF subfamily)